MLSFVELSKHDLKVVCCAIVQRTINIKPYVKDITLLEASDEYVMWGIGKTVYQCYKNHVFFHPTGDVHDDGIVLTHDLNYAEVISDVLTGVI